LPLPHPPCLSFLCIAPRGRPATISVWMVCVGFILHSMAQLGWLPVEVFWGEVPQEQLNAYRHGTSALLQGMLVTVEMPVAGLVGLFYWWPKECMAFPKDLHAHIEAGDAESDTSGTGLGSVVITENPAPADIAGHVRSCDLVSPADDVAKAPKQ